MYFEKCFAYGHLMSCRGLHIFLKCMSENSNILMERRLIGYDRKRKWEQDDIPIPSL